MQPRFLGDRQEKKDAKKDLESFICYILPAYLVRISFTVTFSLFCPSIRPETDIRYQFWSYKEAEELCWTLQMGNIFIETLIGSKWRSFWLCELCCYFLRQFLVIIEVSGLFFITLSIFIRMSLIVA